MTSALTNDRVSRICGRSVIARAAVATTLALAGTLGASPARADGTDTASGNAEALANEAYEQQAAGKFPEAISSYLKAFELSKSGVILFNVATLYDKKLHERDLAAEYFRRYLRAPDAEPELVQKANQRLTTLKHEADEEERKRSAAPVALPPAAVAPEPVAVSAPPAATTTDEGVTETSRPLRPVGVVVGAVGVASLATSAVLAVLAKGKNDDANALCNGQECSSDRGVTLASQAGTMATASTVTFVAGVTLLVGGVTLYFAAPRRMSPSASTARMTLAPDVGLSHAGMTLQGSF
jgi:tetratricopeptide (TPR) repeat protein